VRKTFSCLIDKGCDGYIYVEDRTSVGGDEVVVKDLAHVVIIESVSSQDRSSICFLAVNV